MERPKERAGDRPVRIRVAPERNDPAEPLLEPGSLRGDLEPDPGGEEREPHVGPVDATGPTRLRHEVFQLLPSLAVEDGRHGVLHGRPRCGAADERCRGERHREAGGPAALVPVRDRRERRGLLEEVLGVRRAERPQRRAVHHRPVARRDLGAAFGHVPFRCIPVTIPSPAKHPPREVPDVGRIGREPPEVTEEHVLRVEPPVLRERPPQVPSHRGVVGPRAGGPTLPRQLERGQRVGDLLASPELERGPERVPQREPENAADHPFPQVIHGSGAYRAGPQQGLW